MYNNYEPYIKSNLYNQISSLLTKGFLSQLRICNGYSYLFGNGPIKYIVDRRQQFRKNHVVKCVDTRVLQFVKR